MKTEAWGHLMCPECPRLLDYADVKAFATEQTFNRYDYMDIYTRFTSVRPGLIAWQIRYVNYDGSAGQDRGVPMVSQLWLRCWPDISP